MSTPPPVGKTVSVKVDARLYDDLQTMLATGMTVSDAVRTAVAIVAGTYRAAWDTGRCPQGVRPTIERYWITRYDAGQEPPRGSVQTTVPIPHVPRVTPRPTTAPAGTTPRHTPPPTRPTVRTTGTTDRQPGTTPVRPHPEHG